MVDLEVYLVTRVGGVEDLPMYNPSTHRNDTYHPNGGIPPFEGMAKSTIWWVWRYMDNMVKVEYGPVGLSGNSCIRPKCKVVNVVIASREHIMHKVPHQVVYHRWVSFRRVYHGHIRVDLVYTCRE